MAQSRNKTDAATGPEGPARSLPQGHPQVIRIRRAQLTVVKGPNKGDTHLVSGNLVRVGKADDNDLVVPHETVSRRHFEIVRDAWGYLLRDLGSTNGTYLDGAEIREAYLRSGSVVTAGETKVKFRTQEDFLEVTPYPEENFGRLTGRSDAMKTVFGAVEAVAELDVPVLFLGETGTGRRSLAEILHRKSARRNQPLAEINCLTTSPGELEEALFGAQEDDAEAPKGGTRGVLRRGLGASVLFVEPWELRMETQARMVKALESGRAGRNGASQPAEGTRPITVSSRDLTAEAQRGKMDGRLASHLTAVTIHVPPLRQRPEDIEALVERSLGVRPGQPAAKTGFPQILAAALGAHTWPGNVPELQLFMSTWTEALQRGGGRGVLDLLDSGPADPMTFRLHKRRWVDAFERLFLCRLMDRCQGNVSHAARMADMDRKYLNNLLKRHGLKE